MGDESVLEVVLGGQQGELVRLRAEVERLRGKLQRYKDAVAEELHYNMQAVLSGTPEERARQELHTLRARVAGLETMLNEARTFLAEARDIEENTTARYRYYVDQAARALEETERPQTTHCAPEQCPSRGDGAPDECLARARRKRVRGALRGRSGHSAHG